MGGVGKITNTEINKTYIFGSSRDIYAYADEVESKLINGWHTNKELQQDYTRNPNAFKIKILHISNSKEEIKRLLSDEIDKYWPNGYNKRRGVSFDGGNTNSFARKGLNENEFVMTNFMERLFASLNKSNLSQESKNIIKEKIDNGNITSEFELIRAIREQEVIEKLLDILKKSNLKSKDKKDIENKIKNGTISSEYKLENEIESILKKYNSKNHKSPKKSKKSNSSKNTKKRKNKKSYSSHSNKHVLNENNTYVSYNRPYSNKNKCGRSITEKLKISLLISFLFPLIMFTIVTLSDFYSRFFLMTIGIPLSWIAFIISAIVIYRKL